MFCKNCGSQIPEGNAFCTTCSTPIDVQNPNTQAQPQYQADPYAQYPYQPPLTPASMIPMKWFKFLIYFALWAGAAMNVLNGIAFLTGASYGDMKELVYAFYKDSQTIGIVVGIASIALGVLDIAARFSLAKYKKAGPKLLTSVYAGAIAVNLIYVIGTIAVLPQMIVEELNYTNAISGCVMGAVMIVVDHIYFKKRSHLFIN